MEERAGPAEIARGRQSISAQTTIQRTVSALNRNRVIAASLNPFRVVIDHDYARVQRYRVIELSRPA